MLSTSAQKAAASHRRQNSTPIAMSPGAYAAFANTNHQQPTHRRGLSTGYSARSKDPGSHTDGKASINDTQGQPGQHLLRATQMPASSRPGQMDSFDFENAGSGATPQSQHLTRINEDTEMKDSRLTQKAVDDSMEPQRYGQNPAEVLLELMEKLNSFPNHDIKHLLNEVVKSKVSATDFGGTDEASSTPMKRGHSWQESSRGISKEASVPSPPHTVPLRCSATFDVASFPSTTVPDFSDVKGGLETTIGGYNSSNYSPMTHHSGLSSFQSSPELAPVDLFGSGVAGAPDFGPGFDDGVSPSSPASSPHKRQGSTLCKGEGNKNTSDDEMVFNPNDFLLPSSVTEEEINAFIQGPDETGKFSCLYDGCRNAPFGRKENIRAHVQTHLDDRRYQCDSCFNKFVRPNDLKRHWQIHVNKRDFKCFCGAAFNRHDALKRHRERSEWCESGGTRGSPDSPKRDEKKRGRPKKIAPTESQERRERKALVRREVRKRQDALSAASSVVSIESPPPNFDFSDYPGVASAQVASPSHTTFTPPASPHENMEDLFSPQSAHVRNGRTQQSLSPPPTRDSMLSFGLAGGNEAGIMFADLDPSLPLGGDASAVDSSQHDSPPGLEMGSSSPPRMFDFDLGSEQHLLSQDVTFASGSQDFDFGKNDDMFSKLNYFLDSHSDPLMGMDPSRLDVMLPQSRNNDPLSW